VLFVLGRDDRAQLAGQEIMTSSMLVSQFPLLFIVDNFVLGSKVALR
jgi:hypothetical protein